MSHHNQFVREFQQKLQLESQQPNSQIPAESHPNPTQQLLKLALDMKRHEDARMAQAAPNSQIPAETRQNPAQQLLEMLVNPTQYQQTKHQVATDEQLQSLILNAKNTQQQFNAWRFGTTQPTEEQIYADVIRGQQEFFGSQIRYAILGEWTLVDHANFADYANTMGDFATFAATLKYTQRIEDGKLQQSISGGQIANLVEGEVTDYVHTKRIDLYVEDNHVKSTWIHGSTTDRYIEDGRLWVVCNFGKRGRWCRVYEKVTRDTPIQKRVIGEWKNVEDPSKTIEFVAKEDGSVEEMFADGRIVDWQIDEQGRLCGTDGNGRTEYFEKSYDDEDDEDDIDI